jgi:hypothetical protein
MLKRTHKNKDELTTSLERQGAWLCELCVTVGKHATASVGRFVVYTLNETAVRTKQIGLLQTAQPLHDVGGATCVEQGIAAELTFTEVMEFSIGDVFGRWKEPVDRILHENSINDLFADIIWVYIH